MGKQTKNQEKQKTNPILWFFFAIVIPIVVAITLAVIIFSIAGVNVIDWAKNTGNNIPVISSLVTTDEEKNVQQTEEKLKSSNKSKSEEIDQLTENVSSLEATIEQMEQEIFKLENKETEQNTSATETDEEVSTEKDPVKTISSSYEEMDSEQAAKILQNLDKDLAISILKELPNDVRGNIFDEMDPEQAAELTQLFVESGN